MSFSLDNEKGKIIFSDTIFSNIIKHIISTDELHNKVSLCNLNGKILEKKSSFLANDYAQYITVEKNQDGTIDMSFPVVVTFGESIDEITRAFFEQLEKIVKKKLSTKIDKINIDILGVRLKSGNVIERNLSIKNY